MGATAGPAPAVRPVGEPAAGIGQAEDVRSDDAAPLRASLQDPRRFDEVFERHHERIWRYLARLGGRACADDLASEVFLVAFRRREAYDPDRGSVTSWLYGIATNLARTRARRIGRGERADARQRAERPTVRSAEDLVADRDLVLRTVDALEHLTDEHREVLVLYAWEDLDYASIAAALGIELGTVRSRLHRARGQLRELVGLTGELVIDVPGARRPDDG